MNVQMKAETSTAQTVVLPIEGMTCASCVGRVERALQAVPGTCEPCHREGRSPFFQSCDI